MDIDGRQVKKIQEALRNAYTPDELQQMVRYELNENLEQIAGTDSGDMVTFRLVEWAIRVGRLRDLVNAVYAERADNPHIAELYDEWVQKSANALRVDNSDAAQIFLSYSRKDTNFVRRLRHDLERAELHVWTDEGLEPGTQGWQSAIENALQKTLCLIVVLSPYAKQSRWVSIEISYARARGRRIFPILIAGDQLHSVPIDLFDTQWVDTRENYQAAVDHQLIPAIRRYLSVVGSEPVHNAPVVDNPTAGRRNFLEVAKWGAIGAAVCLLILLMWRLSLRTDMNPTTASLFAPTARASSGINESQKLPLSKSTVVDSDPMQVTASEAVAPATQSSALIEIPLTFPGLANALIRSRFPDFTFGVREYQGVSFDIPNDFHVIATQCSSPDPEYPQEVVVDTGLIEKPLTIFVLLNAAATDTVNAGETIGAVDLGFDNDEIWKTELVVGQNVREWRIEAPYTISTTTDPAVQEVAREISDRGDIGVIDMLTIEVPLHLREETLRSIKFIDSSRQIQGSLNPCLLITGITVRSRQ